MEKLSRIRFTEDEILKIYNLWQSGKDVQEISLECGCSASSVYKYKEKENVDEAILEIRGEQALLNHLSDLLSKNTSRDEICDILRINSKTYYTYCSSLKRQGFINPNIEIKKRGARLRAQAKLSHRENVQLKRNKYLATIKSMADDRNNGMSLNALATKYSYNDGAAVRKALKDHGLYTDVGHGRKFTVEEKASSYTRKLDAVRYFISNNFEKNKESLIDTAIKYNLTMPQLKVALYNYEYHGYIDGTIKSGTVSKRVPLSDATKNAMLKYNSKGNNTTKSITNLARDKVIYYYMIGMSRSDICKYAKMKLQRVSYIIRKFQVKYCFNGKAILNIETYKPTDFVICVAYHFNRVSKNDLPYVKLVGEAKLKRQYNLMYKKIVLAHPELMPKNWNKKNRD